MILKSNQLFLNFYFKKMKFKSDIIEVANSKGKYQAILTLIATLSFLGNSSFIILLPTMSQLPNFLYNNKEYSMDTKEEFCIQSKLNNEEINTNEIYFSSEFPITWASELKLICNSEDILHIISTVYFLASIASNIAFDNFPDRYGRKKLFIILNFFSWLALVQLLHLISILQLIIAAFFMGFATFNLGLVSTLITEHFDYNYSGVTFTFANSMFAISGLLTVLIMIFLRDWHIQHSLILIAFFSSNLLSMIYLSESPKWLAANHKFENLKETLMKISAINGTENQLKAMLTEKCINLENNNKKNRKKSSSVRERKISNQLSQLKYEYIQEIYMEKLKEDKDTIKVNQSEEEGGKANNTNINSKNDIRKESSNVNLRTVESQTKTISKDVSTLNNFGNNYYLYFDTKYNHQNYPSTNIGNHKYTIPVNNLAEENALFMKSRKLYSEDNFTKNDLAQQYSVASQTSSYDLLKRADYEEEENTMDAGGQQIIKLKNYSRLDLLWFVSSRWFTIKNLVLWGVTGFCFFGVFLNLNYFSSNIYATTIVSFSAQLVGLVFSGVACLYVNRKTLVFYSFFFSGVFALLHLLVASELLALCMLFAVVSCLCSAANVIYIYSAECFPTNTRSTALNFFILSERVCSTIVSFVLIFSSDMLGLTAVLCLSCAVMVLLMPDSNGQDTGDELPEYEHDAFRIVENNFEEEDDSLSRLTKGLNIGE